MKCGCMMVHESQAVVRIIRCFSVADSCLVLVSEGVSEVLSHCKGLLSAMGRPGTICRAVGFDKDQSHGDSVDGGVECQRKAITRLVLECVTQTVILLSLFISVLLKMPTSAHAIRNLKNVNNRKTVLSTHDV